MSGLRKTPRQERPLLRRVDATGAGVAQHYVQLARRQLPAHADDGDEDVRMQRRLVGHV
ncbi:hypothetical protein [Micromonospora aurantiaca (nom. illeg.)]|uniref:hypothetical protein n=1 Tax=Micromonospora aurantiaca (nom. illeg.) TaxID=47850 RepID=UPI0033DDE8E7